MSAILEVDREESFTLPGDDGHELVVVRARGNDSMWATAASLAPWLGYSDARAVRAQIRNCGSLIADHVSGITLIPEGAPALARTVAVYSEGAWDLLAERGHTERARAVKAIFKRAIADELRLLRAAANGPLSHTRAVLALALKRLRESAKAMPEGDERDLVVDVATRIAEDRQLVELSKSDVFAAEASRARVAHALHRGEVEANAEKSIAATTRAFDRRMKGSS